MRNEARRMTHITPAMDIEFPMERPIHPSSLQNALCSTTKQRLYRIPQATDQPPPHYQPDLAPSTPVTSVA